MDVGLGRTACVGRHAGHRGRIGYDGYINQKGHMWERVCYGKINGNWIHLRTSMGLKGRMGPVCLKDI